MKHLLDVNVLLAAIIKTHHKHMSAMAWLNGKEIVLCPISELGFIRISTNKKIPGLGLDMKEAREGLEKFAVERRATRIPADLPALDSQAEKSNTVTDQYLADLAAKHGLKLATFDGQLERLHKSCSVLGV